jgi:hypothetical protein
MMPEVSHTHQWLPMIPKDGEGGDDNGGGAPFTRASGSSPSPACNLAWYPVFVVFSIIPGHFMGLASLSKHAEISPA